ncbi:MAG: TlpA family protein disulfide reductase [Clostridia bacterium]|nr:TlpA family protein disulfide reductase [Clostridia bacterium]
MNKIVLSFLLAALLLFSVGCGDVKEEIPPVETPAASETPETGSVEEQEETTVELPQLDGPVFDAETVNLDGETFNVLGFAREHDLTVVNFWATWCGPCVSEMPGLQSLHARFEKGEDQSSVAILGVCLDAENAGDVKAVLEYTGAAYPNIVFAQEMLEYVDLMYIPATVFLDKDGHIVGDPVVGAMDESLWLSEIEKRLGLLGLSL